MEYLQIFDINGVALNEKIDREHKKEVPEGKYFMIVLIFIINNKGEYLLQKTSKNRGSCIATTGGHVSYGENSLDAALKEVKEELNLKLDKSELSHVKLITYGKSLIDIYCVRKDVELNTLTIQEEEVDAIKWCSVNEINKFIENNQFREGNKIPFSLVQKYVETK